MAADSLSHLNDQLDGLIEALSPQARKQLAKQIATTLRKSQAQRIKANKNPDGSAYIPRKPQPGHIKRKLMFQKLIRSKWLKQQATPNAATVSFTPTISHIVRAHQYGLRGRLKGYIEVQYPQRELLGFTSNDKEILASIVLEYLKDTLFVK
ncbi:phage virion morphogenesis protein [Shewanella dokdonensis]|uniref:Phage virion morphogenesis protein n=1 Tax=Shewanella dokdonensis TaxID=712036 RepID=A0ABX8DET8_9GAMM|nr:phage virion morphogenesis protein [Shewanella dokdonensis]MCL1075990.1 phage virion morphogenesis protein [Shewanella dokdonensis]QVK23253.1 phage virion morphogenesis protein [Shewanella dokdonensis]